MNLTPEKCYARAEQLLAQAEREPRHRRKLTAAAQAWIRLAKAYELDLSVSKVAKRNDSRLSGAKLNGAKLNGAKLNGAKPSASRPSATKASATKASATKLSATKLSGAKRKSSKPRVAAKPKPKAGRT